MNTISGPSPDRGLSLEPPHRAVVQPLVLMPAANRHRSIRRLRAAASFPTIYPAVTPYQLAQLGSPRGFADGLPATPGIVVRERRHVRGTLIDVVEVDCDCSPQDLSKLFGLTNPTEKCPLHRLLPFSD